MRHILHSLLICLLAVVLPACSESQLHDTEQEDLLKKIAGTRGVSEDCVVSRSDIGNYILFKAFADGWDWKRTGLECDKYELLYLKFKFEPNNAKVRSYPSDDNPVVYIIDYPSCCQHSESWEIVSSDKRSIQVLAAGEGKFDKNDQAQMELLNHLVSDVMSIYAPGNEKMLNYPQANIAFWEDLKLRSEWYKEMLTYYIVLWRKFMTDSSQFMFYPGHWDSSIIDLYASTRSSLDETDPWIVEHYVYKQFLSSEEKENFSINYLSENATNWTDSGEIRECERVWTSFFDSNDPDLKMYGLTVMGYEKYNTHERFYKLKDSAKNVWYAEVGSVLK